MEICSSSSRRCPRARLRGVPPSIKRGTYNVYTRLPSVATRARVIKARRVCERLCRPTTNRRFLKTICCPLQWEDGLNFTTGSGEMSSGQTVPNSYVCKRLACAGEYAGENCRLSPQGKEIKKKNRARWQQNALNEFCVNVRNSRAKKHAPRV